MSSVITPILTLLKLYYVVPGLLLVVLVSYFFVSTQRLPILPESIKENIIYPPQKIEPFDLLSHTGEKLKSSDLEDQWTFIVFGYTSCPDVCPATLSQLAKIKKLIITDENINIEPHFLFVSIDPVRDTPKVLSDYIEYFDASFIAATGDENNLAEFERQLGVFHRKTNAVDDYEYTVEHSAEIFLIDPKVRLAAKFQPPVNIKAINTQLSALISFYQKPQATYTRNIMNLGISSTPLFVPSSVAPPCIESLCRVVAPWVQILTHYKQLNS